MRPDNRKITLNARIKPAAHSNTPPPSHLYNIPWIHVDITIYIGDGVHAATHPAGGGVVISRRIHFFFFLHLNESYRLIRLTRLWNVARVRRTVKMTILSIFIFGFDLNEGNTARASRPRSIERNPLKRWHFSFLAFAVECSAMYYIIIKHFWNTLKFAKEKFEHFWT